MLLLLSSKACRLRLLSHVGHNPRGRTSRTRLTLTMLQLLLSQACRLELRLLSSAARLVGWLHLPILMRQIARWELATHPLMVWL